MDWKIRRLKIAGVPVGVPSGTIRHDYIGHKCPPTRERWILVGVGFIRPDRDYFIKRRINPAATNSKRSKDFDSTQLEGGG